MSALMINIPSVSRDIGIKCCSLLIPLNRAPDLSHGKCQVNIWMRWRKESGCRVEGSAEMLWVKLLLATPYPNLEYRIWVPAALFWIQLSGNVFEMAMEDGPCHPHGRRRWVSCLLVSAWYLRSELVDWSALALFLPQPLCLSHKQICF